MKISVTSVTGTVGSQVVEMLHSKGYFICALSRNDNQLEDVQYVIGNLDNPETIRPDLVNIDSLFLLTQTDNSNEKYLANQEKYQSSKSLGTC